MRVTVSCVIALHGLVRVSALRRIARIVLSNVDLELHLRILPAEGQRHVNWWKGQEAE